MWPPGVQDALRDVAELGETSAGSSLAARTLALPAYRDLGPPDLVHLVKHHAQHGAAASYHHAVGPDASSPAALSAYLTSLQYALAGGWKLAQATYCAFNAFARVDVRVEVRIPGGVVCWSVDARGERHPIGSDEAGARLWDEAGVSGVLRALLDDGDEGDGNNPPPPCLRKLPPLPSADQEAAFLAACGRLHASAWQLGAPPLVQVSTAAQNWMCAALDRWFGEGGRWRAAAAFWEGVTKAAGKGGGEVGGVVGKCWIEGDEEVKGVEELHNCVRNNPTLYTPLLVQAEFLLRRKHRLEWALDLAKRAVQLAPSEYVTWAKLTECYIEKGDIESALLTLNSCPMFTYTERDANLARFPAANKITVPLKPPALLDPPQPTTKIPDPIPCCLLSPSQWSPYGLEMGDPPAPDPSKMPFLPPQANNEVHPDLVRLPSLTLRGTFLRAYGLLVQIVRKVGWDELLRARSGVFVMEEEYRAVRARGEGKGKKKDAKGKGKAPEAAQEEPGTPADEVEKPAEGADGTPAADGEVAAEPEAAATTSAPADGEEDAEDGPEEEEGPNGEPLPFTNKRLCERWLDNLFMVLYEDLRLYTAFKTEMQHCRQQGLKPQQIAYRKTSAEWEIYGDLAARLEHKEEARDAYLLSLEQRFSSKALLRLLDMYSEEGLIQETLSCVSKLATAWERTYGVPAMPSPICRGLFRLVRRHGLAKVQNAALGLKNYKLVSKYLEFAEAFAVAGSDM
ncbi:Chs5p-Arf1p-binding proteins-domain-containing protein [Hyaloraphidium curvatum]|nr:Chs5p-Arf1p-binding proteins-domain-containing protein [Hyaloraphidium curvatum]